ncbi:MAG: GNAT family N-acetyltransferase, partial [Candidatus Omnitrophota bacterium]
SLPNTELDIRFKSFEEYLKTLSSSTREGLKRNFKKVDAKVKFDLEITDTLNEETLSQVYELYLQTYNNHELGFEKLTKEFFRKISMNMPGQVKYFLWRVDGKLVTFALCLVSGDYFIDYYLGFDYTVSNDYYLYFIRFRDLLKWCIDHGIKRYEMGQTSYEPKRRLGFNFIRYYLYIKHRNKLLNFLLVPVSNLLKPENFDPVFKQMSKSDSK